MDPNAMLDWSLNVIGPWFLLILTWFIYVLVAATIVTLCLAGLLFVVGLFAEMDKEKND